MSKNPILHLIVGKWKTPNHSNKKADDDSHQVKEEILKQIGRSNFKKRVGKNPDIGISCHGKIILIGRGPFSHKIYADTEIHASEYFILNFIPITETNEVEISLLLPHNEEDSKDVRFEYISDRLYILPKDEKIVSAFVSHVIDEYLNNDNKQEENILVVISSRSLRN